MRAIVLWMLFPVLILTIYPNQAWAENQAEPLTIHYGKELSEIAEAWADAYGSAHPGVSVTLSPAENREMHSLLSKPGTVGLVSSSGIKEFMGGECRTIVVGRDVLVPVMNAGNPFRAEILRKGISLSGFGQAYSQGQEKNWGTILGTGEPAPLHTCVVASSTGITRLSEFLDVEEGCLQGCRVKSREEFLELIRGETLALGFCRLCDIVNCETGEVLEGLALVPVDANGNGSIDPFEDIYGSVRDLARGIWIGKYPGKLSSRIYAVMNDDNTTEAGLEFLEWAITDGQAYLADAGLDGLLASERRASLDRIRDTGMPAELSPEIPGHRGWLIGGLALVAGIILFRLISGGFRRTVEPDRQTTGASSEAYDVSRLKIPGGVFFDRNHTWVFMERSGEARVGLDEFIPHVTGLLTGIRMKEPGERVKKGEAFLSLVQKGRRMDISSPVSGVIRENNSRLMMEPGLINQDPLAEGWVYMIQPVNWLSEMKSWLMGDQYREQVRTEFGRFRDFLASVLVTAEGEARPVLQEGGEICYGILEKLGPEVWEEFQSKFIHLKIR
jgi:glycine cleavage system H lipoate-binding protein